MKKITKKNQNTFVYKVKDILCCAVKAVLLTAALLLGLNWLSGLLEIVSQHVSVGAGIFAVFAAACFFIHVDTKNSIEQTGDRKKLFADNR